jgi:hypothetical protein
MTKEDQHVTDMVGFAYDRNMGFFLLIWNKTKLFLIQNQSANALKQIEIPLQNQEGF